MHDFFYHENQADEIYLDNQSLLSDFKRNIAVDRTDQSYDINISSNLIFYFF